MQAFFLSCGELLSHGVRSEGRAPDRKFIAWFKYEKGSAEFDGVNWTFIVPIKGFNHGRFEQRVFRSI